MFFDVPGGMALPRKLGRSQTAPTVWDRITVGALYESVNKLESSAIVPSLHHRKEGWLSDQEISRSIR